MDKYLPQYIFDFKYYKWLLPGRSEKTIYVSNIDKKICFETMLDNKGTVFSLNIRTDMF